MKPNRLRSTRTRAVTEEAKSGRRASILMAARKLFAARDFHAISVDDIAKKAGLAKGTVYLYFGTKEALFLELVAEQLETWVSDSASELKKAKATPPAIAAVVASTLSQRPVLIRLLGLLHAVLQRNTEVTSLREFKRRLLQITMQSGALFERALGLTPGTGIRLTLWMHATIVGLSQMTATSPTLRALMTEEDSLALLRLDFPTEVEAALTTLFTGAVSRTSQPRRWVCDS
jgi:AcrR family transcriptional regulator